MSYEIAWCHEALWIFYRLPLHSATIVDRTVIRFAATGEGEIGWEAPYHRLRAGQFKVWLAIDFAEQRIVVIHIQRAR
jgi:mRNA-degrading endonuclease RelE of RelBE toxin-antitoxin system